VLEEHTEGVYVALLRLPQGVGRVRERWRQSQGIGRDVIAQRAEEVRARLLDMLPRHER
jgi:hypothetical protein